MTHEQIHSDSELRLRKEAEIDVVVRKIEALVIGNDIELLRLAVRVGSSLPRFGYENGETVGESIRDQTRRVVTDEFDR